MTIDELLQESDDVIVRWLVTESFLDGNSLLPVYGAALRAARAGIITWERWERIDREAVKLLKSCEECGLPDWDELPYVTGEQVSRPASPFLIGRAPRGGQS